VAQSAGGGLAGLVDEPDPDPFILHPSIRRALG